MSLEVVKDVLTWLSSLFCFARPCLVLALTLQFSLCLIHAPTELFLDAHGCDRLYPG